MSQATNAAKEQIGFYTTREADDEYKFKGMQDKKEATEQVNDEGNGEADATDQKKKKRKKRKKNKNKGGVAQPTSQEHTAPAAEISEADVDEDSKQPGPAT